MNRSKNKKRFYIIFKEFESVNFLFFRKSKRERDTWNIENKIILVIQEREREFLKKAKRINIILISYYFLLRLGKIMIIKQNQMQNYKTHT